MSLPNATLTSKGRALLALCIVEDGWSLRRAERFQVSTSTARRWTTRYYECGAAVGMHDRSNRPAPAPNDGSSPCA